jgi:hypothetical protein
MGEGLISPSSLFFILRVPQQTSTFMHNNALDDLACSGGPVGCLLDVL